MISCEEIVSIAHLARLDIDGNQSQQYADSLSKILSMMDILSDVDTEGVLPLTNVHDMHQRLRDDVVDAEGLSVDRTLNQSVAPVVDKGLYLVPQVIE